MVFDLFFFLRDSENDLKIFLDMVPSPSTDNVTARVAWMFSWRKSRKLPVKPLRLSSLTKSACNYIFYFKTLLRLLTPGVTYK